MIKLERSYRPAENISINYSFEIDEEDIYKLRRALREFLKKYAPNIHKKYCLTTQDIVRTFEEGGMCVGYSDSDLLWAPILVNDKEMSIGDYIHIYFDKRLQKFAESYTWFDVAGDFDTSLDRCEES